MNLQEAHKLIIQNLLTIYDNREATNIADMVTDYITGYSKSDRILHKKDLLNKTQEYQYKDITGRLLLQEPIQYITGKAWFYKYPFYVNQYVLIPRPETEELVQLIIRENFHRKTSILDIGTGSGCIAISLKKNLTASVLAIDISKEALIVANENAIALKAEIEFKEINFLDKTQWKSLDKYDLIVSNPPYIMLKEKLEMNNNVLAYEPHSALFVEDNDPLIFYRMIAIAGKDHLNNNGCIWVEINEAFGLETVQLFESYGYQTTIYNDLQNKNRMIKATLQ